MDYFVEQSLRSILLHKIYRANIGLVRNDSKAAKLVVDFVTRVSEQVYDEQETEELTLDAAREILFQVEPLVALSEGTVRKYIAELWKDEFTLKSYIKVQAPEHTKFDSRQFG
jgi:hypothetical protein